MDLTAGLKLLGTLLSLYAGVLWLASVLWAYRDVRARSDDPITQAIGVGLVALVPLFGIAVYLIVRPRETILEAYERELEREALRSELHAISPCPNCRRPVEPDFVVCAYCRTQVREACTRCSRLLHTDWQHCPYCDASRPGRRDIPSPPLEVRSSVREADTRAGAPQDVDLQGVARRRPAARRAGSEELEP